MSVIVPEKLPAINFLKKENINLLTKPKNYKKISVSKRIIILNLMFKKIDTENQIIRLLSNSHLLIDLSLLSINDCQSKNINSIKHIKKFYFTFEEIYNEYFDGLIITGAPLGLINFSEIRYWKKFIQIIKWAQNHVHSILSICWSVQAILNILYDMPKKINKFKLSGIFKHKILIKNSFLTKGFDDYFFVPHSRYANFSTDIIKKYTDLNILSDSEKAGAYILMSKNKKYIFITGHPEYDACTIAKEYMYDYNINLKPSIPFNYFPNNDVSLIPKVNWRCHGNLLFSNWLHYFVC
ncbi:homoserine O-succinyltransferase [Enterobacteriaceae endosymbiont of Plateumaris pusilla]|uniref:homoserine O-succinyltransferase n=1 Tax=Enterobacteriaceae endosymbiont of Plateumaris pusilla TaxID=2675795 RepID=UPI0014496796|nr:homoserine O-succinyltransferase [Enterobacteriaceae endosymbiont of Plateumaris pusilla]QJC29520.1 homoserine O-succinyltransferase [Enterobacteriaceae endosymbiont of Plateumaris pusilla]